MKITDLITLTDFMERVVGLLPRVDYFLALSNGEKAVDEISAYYTNDYKGTTAFWQVADVQRKNELITFLCSITIATKPADTSARAGLEARNLTMAILLELIGKLDLEAEEAQQEIEDEGQAYDLVITPAERIFPIGMLANVNLEGHYLDLDITIPANPLLFPV